MKTPTPHKRKNSPFYFIKLTDHEGTRRQISLKTTVLAEAKELAKEAQKEVIKGQTHVLDKAKGKSTTGTVAELEKVYVETKRVKPAYVTRQQNVQALKNILRTCGIINPEAKEGSPKSAGNVRLSRIDDKLAKKFQKKFLEGIGEDDEGFDSRVVTCNAILGRVKSLFSKKSLSSGLYDGIKLGREYEGFLGVPDLDEADYEYTFIEKHLFQNIILDSERLREEDVTLYCAFLVCYTTGLRKTEAAHARWSWIGFDGTGQRAINVPAKWTYNGKTYRTKSRKSRSIPLSDAVYEELQSLGREYLVANGGDSSEFLIPCRTHTERVDTLWRGFKPWFVRNGITDRDKCAHECRKFFGSIVASTQGIYVACKLLGHSSVAVTEKYYADLIAPPTLPPLQLPRLRKRIGGTVVDVIEEEDTEDSGCSPSA